MLRFRPKLGTERNSEWRCCFCLHVRTGTILLGSWHLMLHLIALGFLAAVVRDPRLLEELEQDKAPVADWSDVGSALPTPLSNIEPPPSPYTQHVNQPRDHNLIYHDVDVGALVTVCTLAITLMLIYGAARGKPAHLLPFFCLQIFDFAITIVDGSPWYPKPDDTICSEHFMGNKKSDEEESPSYAPTIFPEIYRKRKVNDSQVLARYTRLTKRRTTKAKRRTTKVSDTTSSQIIIEEGSELETQPLVVDQGCQVNMFSESKLRDTTFICNRLIYSDHCDAEIQVDIATTSRIVMTNNSRKNDKSCCTDKISYEDQSTETKSHEFVGISSIKNDQELLDLAGVSFSNFEFLLTRLTMKKSTVSIKDRLLIFLIKMKTGLTFSALSVLFGVHRTTISRIFHSILQNLACATANLIFWPNRATVQATMPECFRPDYTNTRVIIDCTEFRIEIPTAVDDRVVCYSHYKKGFTAKVIIGITPGGFISFKSKVAGGRKTDSQMTVESRLVDLLETGDVVLADKGFPEIKKVIDESGKEVKIVMPPFLANKNEFSQEETQRTYDIARVRIHVERIMQRLRIYRVLDKIPHNLFYYIDDIVHVCCVLVNLQPPIFKSSTVL